MWKDLADLDVQMDILTAASAGQSIPMCAYSGGVRPAALYAALKDGHTGEGIYAEFSMMFYKYSATAQREVLESAKLKPDIWLSHTKDTYSELAAEHAHDLVEELEQAINGGEGDARTPRTTAPTPVGGPAASGEADTGG